MKTEFLLLAQYDGLTVVPLDIVRRDFFGHLTLQKFLRKLDIGDIPLPVLRIEKSQKAARGVLISDLARYIDSRADAARRECEQLTGAPRYSS